MSKLTVIILKGLPGSGKSTLARRLLQDNGDAVRINKDCLRIMLENKTRNLKKVFDPKQLQEMMFSGLSSHKRLEKFAQEVQEHLVKAFDNPNTADKLFKAQKAKSFGPKEKYIIQIQTYIIHHLMSKKKDIIIDDTNYNSSHLARIRQLCKDYDFKITDMHRDYGITVEECVKRNKERKARGEPGVPDVAIYSMVKKYGLRDAAKAGPALQPISFGDKKFIICDIDGTLADIAHRVKYVDGSLSGKKDWKAFFGCMDKDTVREYVKVLVNETYKGFPIVIVTGRPESYRQVTEDWLKKNGIIYEVLLMRPANDHRPDDIIKQEILDIYLEKDKVEMVIDDRKIVVTMWRRNKLPVIDVGDGTDF